MKRARNFLIHTRWGHSNLKKSTLNHHPKQLNPIETYLFDTFPRYILTYIDIWVSGLEHRERFKAVIRNINTLCNPSLFAIPQELLAPCHNFSAYSSCYNEVFYKWAHRRIPTNTCLCYQLFGSYSTVHSMLTQCHIEFHESVIAC